MQVGSAVLFLALAACEPTRSEEVVLESLAPEPAPVARPAPIASGDTLAQAGRAADPYARAQRLAVLLPTLGPGAVPEARAILEDPRIDLGAAAIDLLVRFWASHEPEEATQWAVMDSAPAYRIPSVLTALAIWAEADPAAAAAMTESWVKVRRDVAEVLPIALVRGWFAKDPTAVAGYVAQLEMGFARQRALAAFVRLLVQSQGPETAIRWAESVSEDDPTYKLAVYRQVGAALPLFDHEAALRWCEAHCDGPYGSNLRNIIARRWVLEDGAAALEWLQTAPEGRDKRVALRRVYSIWGRRDREAALDWMAKQPRDENGDPEPWLEPIFPVYARALAYDSPAEAIAWAKRIDGEEEREIVLIDVARTWRARDEAAAEAWLETSSLSDEAREKVRAPKGGPRRPFGA